MNKPAFSHQFAPDATLLSARALDAQRPWIERGHNALWLIAALWLECALVLLISNWSRFPGLVFSDPDDALRLMEVRNFLAGQSWFDVSQPRVNPPFGGPMHWSRLVDLPIAGIIVAIRPLFGDRMAEIIACASVPVLTLSAMCFSLYFSVKRFIGTHRAVLTVALLVTSFPIMAQMVPPRIDHHAWQVVASVGVLAGLLTLDPRKGGWIAGASTALWVHISGEALPYIAINGAIFGLRYIARPEQEWPRLIRYVGALTLCSAVLLFGVKGLPGLETHCDSMSPPYLLPLMAIFPAMWIGHKILGDATVARRLAPSIVAVAAASAIFLGYSPECLHGPFSALDPLVYREWLLAIPEGQPLWSQEPATALIVLMPSLIGLGGLIAAVWTEKDADRRFDWLSILGMAIGAFVVSVMVLRAMGVAHLLALIGNMWIIARLYPRIAALPSMAMRVPLTVSLCLLTPFGGAALSSKAASVLTNTPDDVPEKDKSTGRESDIVALDTLPMSTLFAPLDVGPDILLRSKQSIFATGHHRNLDGISKTVRAFLLPPDEARKIIKSTHARYLVYMPKLREIERYAKISPNGLAGRIAAGKPPEWLVPVPVKGARTFRVYRIE